MTRIGASRGLLAAYQMGAAQREALEHSQAPAPPPAVPKVQTLADAYEDDWKRRTAIQDKEKADQQSKQAREEIWETMTDQEKFVFANTPTSKLRNAVGMWRTGPVGSTMSV